MVFSSVSDRIFATDVDPIELAERLRLKREESNQASIQKWRAWLAENLDRVLTLSDEEVSDPRVVV
jgi:hypothetical protein